jgi:hypothetical protein
MVAEAVHFGQITLVFRPKSLAWFVDLQHQRVGPCLHWRDEPCSKLTDLFGSYETLHPNSQLLSSRFAGNFFDQGRVEWVSFSNLKWERKSLFFSPPPFSLEGSDRRRWRNRRHLGNCWSDNVASLYRELAGLPDRRHTLGRKVIALGSAFIKARWWGQKFHLFAWNVLKWKLYGYFMSTMLV